MTVIRLFMIINSVNIYEINVWCLYELYLLSRDHDFWSLKIAESWVM